MAVTVFFAELSQDLVAVSTGNNDTADLAKIFSGFTLKFACKKFASTSATLVTQFVGFSCFKVACDVFTQFATHPPTWVDNAVNGLSDDALPHAVVTGIYS